MCILRNEHSYISMFNIKLDIKNRTCDSKYKVFVHIYMYALVI